MSTTITATFEHVHTLTIPHTHRQQLDLHIKYDKYKNTQVGQNSMALLMFPSNELPCQ